MLVYDFVTGRDWQTVGGFTIVFLSILSLLVICQPASAQIIDCTESRQGGVYQVYLDEPSYTADAVESDEDLQNLMGRLVFRLSSVLEGVMEDMGITVPCVISYCEGRKPRGVSDFNKDMVEKLHSRDVILEVWGSLDTRTEESDSLLHEARIYYLLIPVWIETYGRPVQPGMQFAEYTSGSSSTAGKHLDLLQDAPEMRIFVEIGIGINLLLNEEYDEARKFLCSARLQLEQFLRSALPDGPSERETALIEYVDQVARQTVSMAKSNPHYQDALRLIADDAECPCLKGSDQ